MCRVVIADDEYLEREVLKKIISKTKGNKIVGEVTSGKIAIELCDTLKPELIFMNYNMGEINGLRAAQKIREKNKEIIIIITTGYISREVKKQIQHNDINELLIKPIKPSKVEEVLAKYESAGTSEVIEKSRANYLERTCSAEIKTALEYIDTHYHESLTLESVSKLVYLSTYYFSHLFKKELGVTFSSYITLKKINEAKLLLETSEKSILEISTHLSFNEQTYFSKVFKKHVGKTPIEYRKEYAY